MEIINEYKAFDGKVQILQHQSSHTKTAMRLGVFIPDGPIQGALLWLSGLTCTEQNFLIKAGAFASLAAANMVLICPDTSPRGLDLLNEHQDWDFGSGASFYLDALTADYSEHYNMRSYLINELYDWIVLRFKVNNCIALSGHSMGGHGALTLGLTYPDMFSSISAFAPITNPINCSWGQKALLGYLGDNSDIWQKYDACSLIAKNNSHNNPILISQGSNDEFLEQQLLPENFIQACKESTQVLDFQYCAGYDHSYYFISTFISQHIEFHKKYLNNI